jgi:predicted permease
MGSLLYDLRFAVRSLRLSPGFTAVAVLTIGIGIGANTTIFSWLRPLLFDPLPGTTHSSELVAVENFATTSGAGNDPLASSFLDFRDYRDHLKLLDLTAIENGPMALGDDRSSERIWCELVSGNFFDVLGVKPESGRFFSQAERNDSQNTYPVAIISHDFWHTHFHDSASAVGSTLRINRVLFTVIGVAPADFNGTRTGFAFQVWAPLTMYGAVTHSGTWMLQDRNTRNFTMLARLKPGVTIEQARGEVDWLAKFMASANPDGDTGVGATVVPLRQWHFGSQETLLKPVAILMAACGLLLLIVCANIANLLLARATSRQKEFSLRLALGASPGRLARQLLTESLMLATAGSLAGLLVASWLGGALGWLLPAISGPSMVHPPLAVHVLAFTAMLAVAVAAMAGVAPALHAARANIDEALKEGGRSLSAGPRSHRLRGLLVISEVALAVTALASAGIFLRSFQALRLMAPGFSPQGQALVHFDLSTAGYSKEQADSFYRRMSERLERYPGVTGISYADAEPLGFQGGYWEEVQVEGYQPSRGENMKTFRNLIGPGYFDVMKIPLVEGRDFDLRDDAKSAGAMIVSKEFVRRFIAHGDPIGRKVHGWGKWFTIVGVSGDIKIHQASENVLPFFYIPIGQVYRPEYGLTFHVRTGGSTDEAIAAVRREAAAIDPQLLSFDAQPMEEYVAGSLFGMKVAASILSVLGVLGIFLAAMGLYSVMAYSVVQRTGEIGIRMALGAQPSDVVSMVLRQGMGFAAAGLIIGTITSWAAARLLSSTFTILRPADAQSYLAAALFTVLVALLAVAIPAWRALRVDPIVALRNH